MADDEQFSLCWNNFNSNLSAGFHESLCRGDLVDVTLAAEGQFVKAHRLVLSVCSPYFRKMFTQMPANQHAFVFLKDVSHTALKDLIQFMYCGEVNVKQEALPAFISTAEALQIKGLTDSDPPAQSPAEPSTPTPQPIQQISSPRMRPQRTSTRAYKIETVEDSGDDIKQPTQIVIQTTSAPTQAATIAQQQQQQTQHLQSQQQQQQIASTATTTTTVVTHKRPAQRSNIGNAPHIKRTKSTIDPLEVTETAAASTQQISVPSTVMTTTKSASATTVTATSEPEYIDLPIELPTKSEPDYAEDAGEVESADQDATYVEDDSYGEMRYDDSYFENDDGGNGAVGSGGNESVGSATTSKTVVKQQASYSDSSFVEAGDQTNNDAQGPSTYVPRKRGRPRQKDPAIPPEKLLDKLKSAVSRDVGQPAIYASTTKGGMKLIYDGHHFRYSFRKGQYSIFQCCYKENKEECKVRVVSDQKRAYPLDGEHIHYMQATDKSVTALKFEAGDVDDEDEESAPPTEDRSKLTPAKLDDIEEKMAVVEDNPETSEEVAEEVEALTASNFRENIRKRLQRALQSKKK